MDRSAWFQNRYNDFNLCIACFSKRIAVGHNRKINESYAHAVFLSNLAVINTIFIVPTSPLAPLGPMESDEGIIQA